MISAGGSVYQVYVISSMHGHRLTIFTPIMRSTVAAFCLMSHTHRQGIFLYILGNETIHAIASMSRVCIKKRTKFYSTKIGHFKSFKRRCTVTIEHVF